MQTLREYLKEFKIEIPSIRGDAHAKSIKSMGLDAIGDDEGVVVTIKTPDDRKKLLAWMLSNGWDRVDIKDSFPELMR